MNTITETNDTETEAYDGPRCGNPACGEPITIIAGHRRRQYCDNNCKTAAGRARAEEEARRLREEQERQRAEAERTEILRKYGELQPETVELVRELDRWSESRATAVGQALQIERSLLLAQIQALQVRLKERGGSE